jgi:hypothetical protein
MAARLGANSPGIALPRPTDNNQDSGKIWVASNAQKDACKRMGRSAAMLLNMAQETTNR